MTDNVFSLLERLEQSGDVLDEMAAHRFAEVSRAVDNLLSHEVAIEVIAPEHQTPSIYPQTHEASIIDDSAIQIGEARRQLDAVYGGEAANYGEYAEAALTMLKKVLQGARTQKHEQARVNRYRELIRHEAELGGKIFGPVPQGHRREFFCLDATTWVWHEEWIDETGKRHVQTTRYDIRPSGILKAQEGKGYQAVTQGEAQNLIRAARLYRERIGQEIYHASV